MQKPIGIPEVHWFFSGKGGETDFVNWYWTGMEAMFPDGRFFTLLRDPRDIVLSSLSYFKLDETAAWTAVDRVYELLSHEKSRVAYALSYQDLVKDPGLEISRLCEFAGMPQDPACLKALGYLYVQSPPEPGKSWAYRQPKAAGVTTAKESQEFSRSDAWGNLRYPPPAQACLAKADELWHKFGMHLRKDAG